MDDTVGSGYEIRVGEFGMVDGPFAGGDIGGEVEIVIGEGLVLMPESGRPGFNSGWDDVEQ